MKRQGFQNTGLMLVAGTLVAFSMSDAFAQDTNAFGQYEIPPPAATAPAAAPTTPLSSADVQVLQLAQAKVSDSTIITYVQNSGTVYGLDASQIVYLKQQGVSEGVINAMLNQRSVMAAATATQQQQQGPPPNPDQSGAADQTMVAQPSTPPPSTTYVVPDSQTYYYNNWAAPYYSYPYYSSYYYPY